MEDSSVFPAEVPVSSSAAEHQGTNVTSSVGAEHRLRVVLVKERNEVAEEDAYENVQPHGQHSPTSPLPHSTSLLPSLCSPH